MKQSKASVQQLSRLVVVLVPCLMLSVHAAHAQSGSTPPGTSPGAATAPSPVPRMGESDIKAFAALHVAITRVIDSLDVRLAEAKNKTLVMQQELQQTLQARVAALVTSSGLSMREFERRRYLVSADGDTRKVFDVHVAAITGAPLPGTVLPTPPKALIPVPPGNAGVHVGHVVNAGPDTPGELGLLPLAFLESKIAAQHATLASRTPADLAAMKLHAGHVLHALDPSIVPTGPGRGYGLRRASNGVALHIELAAKAEGAPANVTTHAPHVAASARGTAARADQIIALAKLVQSTTNAGEAAKLVNQMLSLANQLESGADTNSDGRVTPDAIEGGLVQVQEHVNLMLRK